MGKKVNNPTSLSSGKNEFTAPLIPLPRLKHRVMLHRGAGVLRSASAYWPTVAYVSIQRDQLHRESAFVVQRPIRVPTVN